MTDTAPYTENSQYAERTPENLYEARGWLLDCGFSDELIFDLADSQIVRFVDREYEGGWAAFLVDSIGHLIDRQLPSTATRTSNDTLAQWSVVIAKAAALAAPHRDQRTAAPCDQAQS
ncbi:hypothetical protein ACFULT_22025 [Rhodococcus sp. NPDC057297]|uniref:hypothetical protein n=1 Tax=Rhodococcus sp. NPDC057297 TaxID=3346090 RepID=UPI00362C5010